MAISHHLHLAALFVEFIEFQIHSLNINFARILRTKMDLTDVPVAAESTPTSSVKVSNIKKKKKSSAKLPSKTTSSALPSMPSKKPASSSSINKTNGTAVPKSKSATSNAAAQGPATICDGGCLAERRVVCRELGKWGRQTLTLFGLENVFQRALGPTHWRRYNRAVKVSISNPTDFCPSSTDKTCNWCLGSREGATGHETCPTMNQALLNARIGNTADGLMQNGVVNNNSTNNCSPPSSAGSLSSASSPNSAPTVLPPNSTLFPSLLFGASQMCNGQSSATTVKQTTSAVSAAADGTSPTSPLTAGPTGNPMLDPFARLFAMQNNGPLGSQQVGHSTAAERMAITAAAMQFMAASAAANGSASNGANGQAPMMQLSLFPFSSGIYPTWPFPSLPHHFMANGQSDAQIDQNGSAKAANVPTSSANGNLELHQQLALAWHSQLLATIGYIGTINSFCSAAANNREQQQLTSSEDEAVAFLLGQRQQSKKPMENGRPVKKAGNGDEEPLDLSAKRSQKSAATPAKLRAAKRSSEMAQNEGNAPTLPKISGSLQALDDESDLEEEEKTLEELDGPDGMLLEDGSEAESPKLGTKKAYTQADLDAAVSDIRKGRLGTRRASVVYGIPRSTLRNKIYKLETADDSNGAKRRRLTAMAVQKREQRLIGAGGEKTPESGASLNGTQQQDLLLNANDEQQALEMPSPAGNSSNGSPQNVLPSILGDNPLATSAETLFKQLSGQIGQFVGQFQKQQNKKTPKSAEKSVNNDGQANGVPAQNEKDNNSKIQRPKRGQYRKYDKDALDKAVAAVRRGEMSVHKAGTHFGVPHSTLEYKVKERQLLRKGSKKNLVSFNSAASLSLPSNDSTSPPSAGQLLLNGPSSGEPDSPITGEVRNWFGNILDAAFMRKVDDAGGQ